MSVGTTNVVLGISYSNIKHPSVEAAVSTPPNKYGNTDNPFSTLTVESKGSKSGNTDNPKSTLTVESKGSKSGNTDNPKSTPYIQDKSLTHRPKISNAIFVPDDKETESGEVSDDPETQKFMASSNLQNDKTQQIAFVSPVPK
jgi:hypothetical protein